VSSMVAGLSLRVLAPWLLSGPVSTLHGRNPAKTLTSGKPCGILSPPSETWQIEQDPKESNAGRATGRNLCTISDA